MKVEYGLFQNNLINIDAQVKYVLRRRLLNIVFDFHIVS